MQSTNAQFPPWLLLEGGSRQAAQVIAASRSSPSPHLSLRPHPRYHIGQGLLIVRRQAGENRGERKGIMATRGEERGSGRKEGQTGYYEREG